MVDGMVVREDLLSPDLIKHCDNVKHVCDLIYEGTLKDELLRAAEIHDLGKYFISDRVLDAPRALTIPERMIVDMHSQLGYYEAKMQGENELVCQLIILHHGLAKVGAQAILQTLEPDAISLYPYLMAADIYSAVRETRSYHKGKTHDEAMNILRDIRDIPTCIKDIVDGIHSKVGEII